MIRLLGRQTSGNVQKVLFMLEELALPYVREDYGRQFNNTNTDEYRKLNPTIKVPTLIDGEVVIWESNTILRYLAAKHKAALGGGTLAEKTYVERWMDWQLGALNTPYVAVFKDARKPAAERGADFAAQSADLIAQLKILRWAHRRQSLVCARPDDNCRHLFGADRKALPGISNRSPGLFRVVALAEINRCTAGIRGCDRHQAKRFRFGGLRIKGRGT